MTDSKDDEIGEFAPVDHHVVMLGSAAGSVEPATTIEDFRTVRVCPRCRYTIHPGYWHEEQPQPEGASHVVCKLRRANGAILRGPMTEVISKYLDEQAPPIPQATKEHHMTWQAKFKVEDVGEGPAPINVKAVARVEDGTLIQNTEHASVMELNIVLDTDETAIKIGDEITGTGHFTS